MSKNIAPLVCIGVPFSDHMGTISSAWADARADITLPLGASMMRLNVMGQKVDDARNEIGKAAVDANCDWLLFVGSDNIVPPNIFMQLASHDVDIVNGVYWTKSYPKTPYLWRGVQRGPYMDWKIGEFFQIDMAGMDATLIKVDVLRKMEYPWWDTNWTWDEGDAPSHLATEDFYFYTKAMKAGYKIWCDSTIQVGHQDRKTGVVYGLTSDMPQARTEDRERWKGEVEAAEAGEPEDPDRERRCADIGGGNFSEHFDGKIVVFDQSEISNADFRCDVRKLPEPDESYDEIRAMHVLEHFRSYEAPGLLAEWLRILRPGGQFTFAVPNFEWAIQRLCEHNVPDFCKDFSGEVPLEQVWHAWSIVYGGLQPEHQKNPFMAHGNGYTPRVLKNLMNQIEGVSDYEIIEAKDGLELRLVGTKEFTPQPQVLLEWWNEAVEVGTTTMSLNGQVQPPDPKEPEDHVMDGQVVVPDVSKSISGGEIQTAGGDEKEDVVEESAAE